MLLTGNSYTRITLALDIVRKIQTGRFAGYHELGTVKHRIDLCDTVAIEDAPKDLIECNDPAVPCDGGNLCLKAVDQVRLELGIDRAVRIMLRKRIPVMGGLAGGSANAATTLLLLNELWGLGLTTAQLIGIGRNVGMDVPFYFFGGTAFDTEAGQQIEPVANRCSFDFVLALSGFGVSTKEAYAGIDYGEVGRDRGLTGRLAQALAAGDRSEALRCIHNDFETSVFARHPELAAMKQGLLAAGCEAAFLTGSGSTVVGVARDAGHAQEIGRRVGCRTIISATLGDTRA